MYWIPASLPTVGRQGMTPKLVKLNCYSREGGNPEGLINKIAQFRL